LQDSMLKGACQRYALPAGGRSVDSLRGQYKPEARKKPENTTDSHTSGARCVSPHALTEPSG
jgi:hypothetical protein